MLINKLIRWHKTKKIFNVRQCKKNLRGTEEGKLYRQLIICESKLNACIKQYGVLSQKCKDLKKKKKTESKPNLRVLNQTQ